MRLPNCKGCTDRVVGCHAKCEKYLEWNKEHLEELRRIREEKDEYFAYKEVVKHRYRKLRLDDDKKRCR